MKKLLIILLPLILLSVVALLLLKPAAEIRGKYVPPAQTGGFTAEQQMAKDLAFADPEVQRLTAGHRSELFGVRKVIAGQYTAVAAACATAVCMQVELYNWDENTAVTALVNVDSRQVLDVLRQPGMHPGISPKLAERALEIAMNAPEVIAALGRQPTQADMAPVDADMPGTICDGRHLCVGPTFNLVAEDRILWAIVDLTDDQLVGITYTEGDLSSGQAELHTPDGCPAPGAVNRDGWTLDYATTNSDGLNVYNIAYNGTAVATSIKLLEWHVDYGTTGFRDSTGCGSGGGGFPIYPYGETQVLDLLDNDSHVIGFEVVQDFRMSLWGQTCNYRYEQHLQFYQDGQFRVVGGAFGRGCGEASTYRPVTRIDMAVNGDANDSFSRWDGATWQPLTSEDYLTPYTEVGHGPHFTDTNGYSWRIDDTVTNQGYYMMQDVGQFDGEAGRGASPFLYATLHKPAEGDTDMSAFGPCCNDDQQQGPDMYVDGEDISSQNIVLWYVPQSETIVDAITPDYYCWTLAGEPNPDTYPCFSGPIFIPTDGGIWPFSNFENEDFILLGDTAVFTNTTIGAAPITYEWNFGDGSPITTTVSPTHIYTMTNLYHVVLTATNSFGYSVYENTMMVGELANTYLPAILKEE